MSTLYVLGNGFDLMHNIPSRYSDFKLFLENKKEYNELYSILNELFDKVELWRDFENELSKPNQSLLTKLNKIFGINVIGKEFKKKLQEAFNAWIRQVNNFKINKIFKFRRTDIFLSFNYTTTLEIGYDIELDNILHIHNCIGDNLFDGSIPCIFGHDSREFNDANKEWIEATFKNTDEIIKKNITWFDNLKTKDIDEIRVIGFSYNKVDDRYFQEINRVLPNKQWILNLYSPHDLGNSWIFFKRIGLEQKNIKTSTYGGGNING